MIAERINGGWSVYGTVDGHLVSRRYFGYTKKEAISKFRSETRKSKPKKKKK